MSEFTLSGHKFVNNPIRVSSFGEKHFAWFSGVMTNHVINSVSIKLVFLGVWDI